MINLKLEIINECDKYLKRLIESWWVSWSTAKKLIVNFSKTLIKKDLNDNIEFLEELEIIYPEFKIPLFSLMEEYEDSIE